MWEFKSMYFYSVLLEKTVCAGRQPRCRRAGQEVFNHSSQAWPSPYASTALTKSMSHPRPYYSQIICSLWQEGFLQEGSGTGVVLHRPGWWWRSDVSRLAVQIFIAPLLIFFFLSPLLEYVTPEVKKIKLKCGYCPRIWDVHGERRIWISALILATAKYCFKV